MASMGALAISRQPVGPLPLFRKQHPHLIFPLLGFRIPIAKFCCISRHGLASARNG
jgi:hypothetical protein